MRYNLSNLFTTIVLLVLLELTMSQTLIYVDSESSSWWPTGSKSSPFQEFKDAFSKACSKSSQDLVQILFVPRSTPYTISSGESYINCGKILLSSASDNSQNLIRLTFKAPLQITNSIVSFSNILLEADKNNSRGYQSLLAMTASEAVFSNCQFDVESAVAHVSFFNFSKGNLTIESAKFGFFNQSNTFSVEQSRVSLNRIAITANMPSPYAVMRISGTNSSGNFHPNIAPELIASEIQILHQYSPHDRFVKPMSFIQIINMNTTLENITVIGSDDPKPILSEGIILVKAIQPWTKFQLKNFTIWKMDLLTSALSAHIQAPHTLVSLDMISIRECNVNTESGVLTSKAGQFEFILSNQSNTVKITNVLVHSVKNHEPQLLPDYNTSYLFLFLLEERLNSVALSNINFLDSEFYGRVFSFQGFLDQLSITNIVSKACDFRYGFLEFIGALQLVEENYTANHAKRTLENIEFSEVNTSASFMLFASTSASDRQVILRQLEYFPIKNMKVNGLRISQPQLETASGSKKTSMCLGFFLLSNVGVKIYESTFENIKLNEARFISVIDKMVPVRIEGSNLSDFYGESKNSRFFWKSQTDLDSENTIDMSVQPFPVLTSFSLVDNSFSGTWNFENSPQIFTLNVPNAFIYKNVFRDISFNCLLAMFSVLELYGDNYLSYFSTKTSDYLQSFLLDPEMRGLFTTYDNQGYLQKNLSIFHVFDQNNFSNLSFHAGDFISTKQSIQKISLFLFQSNSLVGITSSNARSWGNPVVSRLIRLEDHPLAVIQNNTVANSRADALFTECKALAGDFEIVFKSNRFIANEGVAVLSFTGEQFTRIIISNNSISELILKYASVISISVETLIKQDLIISDNSLNLVELSSNSYDQENIIGIYLPRNNESNIIINNLSMTNCGLNYTHSDQLSGPRRAALYIMLPKAKLLVENSYFEGNWAIGATSLMMIHAHTVEFTSLNLTTKPGMMTSKGMRWESPIILASNEFYLYNSTFFENVGNLGGVFNFENLLSSETQEMSITIVNNVFAHNLAKTGGVFYINPSNFKPLALNITKNHFHHNHAYFDGGVLYIEMQTISRAEINDCSFFYEDFYFKHSAIFFLRKLAAVDVKTKGFFVIRNIYVNIFISTRMLRGDKASSLVFFDDGRTPLYALSLFISNFTVDTTIALLAQDADIGIHIISVDAGKVLIANLNVSGTVTSKDIIRITPQVDLTVADSVFDQNRLIDETASAVACIIGLDQTNFEIDRAPTLRISNTSFRGNFIEDGGTKGSLICLRNNRFVLEVGNGTKVSENLNVAPVFLSTPPQRKQLGSPTRIIYISDSHFENNCGSTEHGGVIRAINVNLTVINSSFVENGNLYSGAHRGGAISVLDALQLSIQDTNFTANFLLRNTGSTTTSGGGAIHIELSDVESRPIEHVIRNCIFERNLAPEGQGGAIYVSASLEPQIIHDFRYSNTFVQNGAPSGDDVSTPPASMRLRIQNKTTAQYLAVGEIENYGLYPEKIHGYHFQETNLNFTLFDFFGNSLAGVAWVSYERPAYTIFLSHTYLDGSISSLDCNYGWCMFSGEALKLKGNANETLWVNATFLQGSASSNVSFAFKVILRDCLVGEVNSTSKGVCVKCDPDTYSFNPSERVCCECPNGFSCPGGSQLNLKPGFWRQNASSIRAVECRPLGHCNKSLEAGFVDSNYRYGDAVCVEGRAGPLCLGCDLQNKYTMGLGMSCAKCITSWLAIFPMLGYNFVLFAFEIWYIWRMKKINTAIIVENRFKQEYLEKLARGGYLSIFLQYAQILAIIKNLPSLALQYVKNLLPVSNPSQTIFYSTDCTLLYFGVQGEDIFFWKLVIIAGMPWVKLIFFSLYGGIYKLFSRKFRFMPFIVIVIIGIILIEQPGIIYNMVAMFSCQSVDPEDPSSPTFVPIAPTVECKTERFVAYRNLLAVPQLIFWGILVPMSFFIVLYKNRSRLSKKEFAIYFGSFYSGFNRKNYNWRAIQMLITTAMTILSQLGAMDHTSRGMSIILFLVLYLLYLRSANPYRFEDLYRTDIIATSLYVATTYLAVYGAVSEKWLNFVAGVILILINVCFIVFIVIKSLELVGLQKIVLCGAKVLNACFCGMLWEKIDPSDYRRMKPSDSIASKLPPEAFRESIIMEGESDCQILGSLTESDNSQVFADENEEKIENTSKERESNGGYDGIRRSGSPSITSTRIRRLITDSELRRRVSRDEFQMSL